MDPIFNKDIILSLFWLLNGFGSVFFLRFGGQSVPNMDYFWTLLQLYYSKDGKLKTSVSTIPNTTFSSFEGLGRNILDNSFQHFFWDGF